MRVASASTLLLVGYGLSLVGLGVLWMVLLLLLLGLLVAKLSTKFEHRHEETVAFLLAERETSRRYTDDGWINKLIPQFWPSMVQHITTNIRQSLEEQVLKSMDKYNMGGKFELQSFTLGSNPIHIRKIEVMKQFSRTEAVIHVDIEYKSDCKISFKWIDLPGSVNDFWVQGRAMVVLGPIFNSPPFVSNFRVTFLEKPTVHYRLSGIATFLELCGFRDKLQNYMATMNITFGDTQKKTSECDKRAIMSDDKTFSKATSAPLHKSNGYFGIFWYLNLFFIFSDTFNSIFSSIISLFNWLCYSLLTLYIFSLFWFSSSNSQISTVKHNNTFYSL